MTQRQPNYKTDLGYEPPIPAITSEVISTLADHIKQAKDHPNPDPAEDNRWHDGAEMFVRLDAATVKWVREHPNHHVPLLYLSQVETDEVGDLIVTAFIPD